MQEQLGDRLSDFFWRYLMKDGGLPRWDDTYDHLRDRLDKLPDSAIPLELQALSRYGQRYFTLWQPEAGQVSEKIRERLHKLNAWEVDVAYPFLLNLLEKRDAGQLSDESVDEVLSMIESFVVRRMVCGVPTNRLRRIFARMSVEVDFAACVETARSYLVNSVWPDDAEFTDKFSSYRLYIPGRLTRTRLVLEMMEGSFGQKEKVTLDENITIEHIMPQTLTPEWRDMLGESADEVHSRWLHTPGT